MIKLYYHPSPNPMKVALFLEESGMPYEMVPVDTRRGAQHDPEFLRINPNAKTPAIVDTDGDVRVFDSNAILLYLAEKSGQFLPKSPALRGEILSWLMFVATGLGPYNGQAVHFQHHAPDNNDYAVNRYRYEAKRHFGIIDANLAQRQWMLGDEYTIVDMAVWGWTNPISFVLADDNAIQEFPNLARMHGELNKRPATDRARELGKSFTTPNDDEAKRHLFRHREMRA